MISLKDGTTRVEEYIAKEERMDEKLGNQAGVCVKEETIVMFELRN